MIRKPVRLFPALWGAFLAGCLGGELDTPTVQPVSKDTTVVVRPPPKDSTPAHDSVPAGAVRSLYPRLQAGEKWAFAQWSGTDTGTTYNVEVAGDSVYGSDSVYIQNLTVRALDFLSSNGYLVRNYAQTGRLYIRKSDQETVHDTLVTRMDLYNPGDTVGTPYREEEWSETSFSGALPDSLEAEASWKLRGADHQRTTWYFGNQPGGTQDTVLHQTRTFRVKAAPPLTVKAGTFDVLEIDQTDSGSTAVFRQWFAKSAKSMVRQIYSDSDYADTTELSSYLLK